jgi:hypothetical protein
MKTTPDSYNMRRNKHRQATMLWQGLAIRVDAGLEPLLTLFNQIPGIATVASCIGDDENLGYVSFVGDRRSEVRSWVERFDHGGVIEEASYRDDIHSGCIRFRRDRLDEVVRIVAGIVGIFS